MLWTKIFLVAILYSKNSITLWYVKGLNGYKGGLLGLSWVIESPWGQWLPPRAWIKVAAHGSRWTANNGDGQSGFDHYKNNTTMWYVNRGYASFSQENTLNV
jgi:hypothetical protein